VTVTGRIGHRGTPLTGLPPGWLEWDDQRRRETMAAATARHAERLMAPVSRTGRRIPGCRPPAQRATGTGEGTAALAGPWFRRHPGDR
jgi:hypothetical protein